MNSAAGIKDLAAVWALATVGHCVCCGLGSGISAAGTCSCNPESPNLMTWYLSPAWDDCYFFLLK